MTFMQDLLDYINAQTWLPTEVFFDVAPKKQAVPYYVAVVNEDAGVRELLCEDQSGQPNVEFSVYGKDRHSIYTGMVEFRKRILNETRGELAEHNLWSVSCSGVLGLGTADKNIYRFYFDALMKWEA